MKCKCKHEWEYFSCWDTPNGYEYEHIEIPHRKCKKCGRWQNCFNNYGECKSRWRNVEY